VLFPTQWGAVTLGPEGGSFEEQRRGDSGRISLNTDREAGRGSSIFNVSAGYQRCVEKGHTDKDIDEY
jgi:hypothetical protein